MNEHFKNYKYMYVCMGISFIVMLLIFSSTDASGATKFFISLIFGAILGVIIYVLIRSLGIIANDPQDAVDKFMGGTKEERKIEQAYQYGNISYMERDVLMAKAKGETSMTEKYGISTMSAMSDSIDAHVALKKEMENAEKKIIIGGAIGSAIGGVPGTIIGAGTMATKEKAKINDLQAKSAAADAKFQETIKK